MRPLEIPNPCEESWSEMTPVEQGKFCNSCQKCVTDFTSMTTAEIKAYFQEKQGAVCGRIGVKQLEALNQSLQSVSSWHKWKLAAATLTGLTLAVPSMGQTTSDVPSKPVQKIEYKGYFHAPEQVEKVQVEVEEKQKQAEKWIVGKIVDADTKETVPFVNVHIVGTDIGTTCDFDGIFSLTLNEEKFFYDAPIILRFESIGYETRDLELKKMPNQELEVAIYLDPIMMGDMISYRKPNIFSRTWFGIKNIFRKKH